MKMSILGSILPGFLCFMVMAGPILGAESVEEEIRRRIKHADTYYWFGMAEKGNAGALRRGLALLEEADKLVQAAPLTGEVSLALQREIDALRVDISNQIDVCFDTLYGVFPLVRLLVPSLFADAMATGTFELIDDPDIIASTGAAMQLCNSVIAKWGIHAQLDAVFNSVPYRPSLESETLYIFNASDKIFVRNFREVSTVLSPEEIAQFQAARITPEIKNKLLKSFERNALLIVTVRELDVIGMDYFFLVEGRFYSSHEDEPIHYLSNMGFCRDRRAQFWPIIFWNAGLLLLGLVAYVLLMRKQGTSWPSLPTLAAPVAGFLMGRAAPWILVPLAGSISPPPEVLAKLSFWWPVFAGLVLFLGPVLLYRLVSIRIRPFTATLGMDGKGGALSVAIGMGACAYLAGPLHLLLEEKAPGVLIPLTLAGGIILWTLGRALDAADNPHLGFGTLSAVVVCGIGAAVCHAGATYLWLGCGVAVFCGVLIAMPTQKKKDETAAGEIHPPSDLPEDVGKLIDRTAAPPYRPFGLFDTALNSVEPVLEGTTQWLALEGPSGRGKTATARAVIAELRRRLEERGDKLALLDGESPEPADGETLYGPFRKALARYFSVNMLVPPEDQLKQIDLALGGIFDSVVPFSGLLFPPLEDAHNGPGTRDEVFTSVARTIRKLAEEQAVVLFIDDSQWLDQASRDLLLFLLKEFPAGGAVRFAVVLAGQDRECLNALGVGDFVLEVESLERHQRCELLVYSLGLESDVAQRIVGELGDFGDAQGELFWLFQLVAHLGRAGAFQKGKEGFTWTEAYRDIEQLPQPDELRSALEKQLQQSEQYRPVLECAACLGLEFRAGVLAESLGVGRLEMLQILDRIEGETLIITDVREADDVYAFRSSFMLRVVRSTLRIGARGPGTSDVPQIIREYHARVAFSLEKLLEHSPGGIFDVARHFYAAGATHAGKARDYCLKAARASRRMFEFAQARDYVGMAEECAAFADGEGNLEDERLIIDCDEAHVTGVNPQEAARKGLEYIKRRDSGSSDGASFRVLALVARACYDAGSGTEGRTFLQEAVRLGRLIAERTESPIEKAEGYHFVGISMPNENPTERQTYLGKALGLVESFPEDNLAAQSLLARVSNSLAEQLSRGGTEEAVEKARQLFERSLEIKERPEIMDRPGMARSHGGMGRLARFSSSPDIPTARYHFEQDLKLSEEIGDIVGQTKMHSLLGACDRVEGDVERALAHYRQSYDLAATMERGTLDRFFAGAGLVMCLAELDQLEELNHVGQELVSLSETAGIPKDCVVSLREALEACKGNGPGDWYLSLRNALPPVEQ